jgi:hypothetical protein
MTLLRVILEAVNARKNRALRLAQVGMSESQFQAFRGLFLDEFGRNGLETEIDRIVSDHERRQGKDSGRPTHAGKEVPHD